MSVTVASLQTATREYYARPGSHLSQRDAQIVGPELERLGQNGPLSAEIVVDQAREGDSPLHRFFEWDDHLAAAEHRHTQARYLLRSVIIKVVEPQEPAAVGQEPKTVMVRAFHAVEPEAPVAPISPKRSVYVSFDTLKEHPDWSQQVIEEARKSLLGWSLRYRQYRALLPAFDERFGDVLDTIDNVLGDSTESGHGEAR